MVSKLIPLIIVFCLTLFLVWQYNHYPAKTELIDDFLEANLPTYKVSISNLDSSTLVFKGENTKAALAFYPGANVDYNSYKPLMAAIASKGIMCVLYKMPLNIPNLNIFAAKGIQDKFPEIDIWYIGGHSLGGVCSSVYLYLNKDKFDGLILFSSFTVLDFSKTDLKVISILGTEDKVIKMNKYNKYKKNYPEDFTEIIIEGGCHSYFGMYGLMKNDGKPTISNIEQIEYTANEIAKLVE